ncbi:MAG TPA: DMT family transporter [Stellaceae bacterium]|nr:DMT family transporter [Stellaceae bacterium]
MVSLAPINTRFAALPPITRSAFWVITAGFCATIMNVVVREAAKELHSFEITFFRCLFGFLVMIPWIVKVGFGALKTSKIGFYTMRGMVSLVSMLTWFYGITLVPLSTATALNFTAPLFSTLGAALILRETVRIRRWAALAVGFVGTLVVLRPTSEGLDPNAFYILASALTGGMNVVTVKFLARTESPNAIVTYLMLYVTPLSLIPALFVWQWPSLTALAWLILLGALGTASHLSVVRGYRAVDASACAPFEFLRLPFAAFLGYAIFHEVTDLWTWVGAITIAASSIYVAHREAKLARLRARAPSPAISAREPLPRA